MTFTVFEPQNGSHKSTSKAVIIAGTVLGAVICIVGIVLILARFESRLSPGVLEFAILGATVGVLLGVSTVLFRVIHGALPELPASVPEEMGERRGVRRAALFCLCVWVVVLATVFLLGAGAAGTIAGAFSLLIGLPILSTLYLVARRRDRNVTLMLAHPWVLWEYDPESWRGFAKGQTDARLRRQGKQTPRMIAGPEGLLTGDKFLAWREPGTCLTQAWRTPAAVVFRFQVILGKSTATLEMKAPIPTGAEDDVRRLQERLESMRLSADVRLA